MDEDEIDIAAAAAEPEAASGDQGSVDNRPLPDLIEADRYAKAKAALGGNNGTTSRSAWGMTRTARVRPAGPGD